MTRERRTWAGFGRTDGEMLRKQSAAQQSLMLDNARMMLGQAFTSAAERVYWRAYIAAARGA